MVTKEANTNRVDINRKTNNNKDKHFENGDSSPSQH